MIPNIEHEIERIKTMLIWIDEHRASFEKSHDVNELVYLKDATEQGILHLDRLRELINDS